VEGWRAAGNTTAIAKPWTPEARVKDSNPTE